MSSGFLLASAIGVNLTFSVPAEVVDVQSSEDLVVKESVVDISSHIRAQLQERNRLDAKQSSNSPVIQEGLFERYRGIDVSAALLNRAVDYDNLVDRWAFDPQRNFVLDQELTEPFLVSRGIKEVISVGVSDFAGSSPNRIKNIEATLEKFDGYIIPQGREFSFNAILDDVTKEGGFKYERVIVNGKDQWGLGGGICQASTNVFRAALNAGMPILERRNHSQAITKYAPHGLDATVYIGKQDLKFKNDTPGDILMKFVLRDNKLFTVFYGTKDGRQVKLEKTKHWAGYDGRLTTHWTRRVSQGAASQEEVFISHYQSGGPVTVASE